MAASSRGDRRAYNPGDLVEIAIGFEVPDIGPQWPFHQEVALVLRAIRLVQDATSMV